MVAALLIRRKQFLMREFDEPFPAAHGASGIATASQEDCLAASLTDVAGGRRRSSSTVPRAGDLATSAEQITLAPHENTRQKSVSQSPHRCVADDADLPAHQPSAAIDLLASQPHLLEQLRKAHMGNYQIVLSLLSSLDNGRAIKRLVDTVIDACE